MKSVLTPIEMKATDKNTEALHIPTLSLMENAGAQIARYIFENYSTHNHVTIYCGTGGNGGDGFVAARHLLNYNFMVHVILLSKPENIKNKDTQTNWDALGFVNKVDENLKITKVYDSSLLGGVKTDIILDAIVGTGIQGKIRQPVSKAIDIINNANVPVISIDIPTGISPETGLIHDKSVKSRITLTLHKPKVGLIQADKKHRGTIEILNIGIPKASEIYVGPGDLLKLVKSNINSHKGNNGSILIVGSNPDYVGAVIYAAIAASKQGIDLIHIAVPESQVKIIKQYNPSFIVHKLIGKVLSITHYDIIQSLINKVDSILIGPGAGLCETTEKLFNKIVLNTDKPIIIDADALKLVKRENIIKANTILTPHKYEFEVFFSTKLSKNQNQIITSLFNLVKKYNATILLKGVTDIITSKNDFKLNNTGNEGMTMGGTGDMLSGIVTALVAKGNSNFESAYLATYLLGMAGDKALHDYGINYTQDNLLSEF